MDARCPVGVSKLLWIIMAITLLTAQMNGAVSMAVINSNFAELYGFATGLGLGSNNVVVPTGGNLVFSEGNGGGNTLSFRAPTSIVTNVTWTLPATDGTSGQTLTTDGAGNLSWGQITLPLTTRGDILYKDPSNTLNRLPVGLPGQVITTDGTNVYWGVAPSTSDSHAEAPVGVIDDVNTVFTLSTTPSDSDNVIVLVNGVTQYNGIDYTVSGNTITFVDSPSVGSTVFAYYFTESSLPAATGTVTSISVATANGFSGVIADPTTTPVISIATSVTGIPKGDGTAFSAATPETDYVTPSGTGTLSNKTLLTPTITSFVNSIHDHSNPANGGTLSLATATSGTLPASRGGTGLSTIAVGDILVGAAANTITNIGIGSAGQVLTVSGGTAVWQTPSSGFADPLTTVGDIIFKNNSNVTTRFPIGTNGQVLSIVAGNLSWIANSAGFADPLTTRGDIIVRDASNTTARLAVGANGYVLTSNGTDATWQPSAAGSGVTSGAQTWDGVKTFTSSPLVPSPTASNQAANKSYVDAADTSLAASKLNNSMSTSKVLGRTTAGTGAVEEISIGSGLTLTAGVLSATASGVTITTGAQSFDGVKTFTSSPVVPAPTNPTDATNKAYVDAGALGTATLSGSSLVGRYSAGAGTVQTVGLGAGLQFSGSQIVTTAVSTTSAYALLTLSGSYSIGTGYFGIVNGWTERIDASNIFNTTTGLFTAPVTGEYLITANISASAGFAFTVGDSFYLRVNSPSLSFNFDSAPTVVSVSGSVSVHNNFSHVVRLLAGESVWMGVWNSTSRTITGLNGMMTIKHMPSTINI
jgi:hypothetical protein